MDEKRGFVEVPPWLPTGVTPVRYALNWGAFETDNVLAIHCVHVDEDDLKKLKEYDVAVGVCPRCNAQLGMGVAPVNEFLRAGLRLGIGTDSPAATDSTDMLEEMRLGMLVQRAVDVNEFLDSSTMLEMATMSSRAASREQDRVARRGEMRRHHSGRPFQLASISHDRSGFRRGKHLQRHRRAHDHG